MMMMTVVLTFVCLYGYDAEHGGGMRMMMMMMMRRIIMSNLTLALESELF